MAKDIIEFKLLDIQDLYITMEDIVELGGYLRDLTGTPSPKSEVWDFDVVVRGGISENFILKGMRNRETNIVEVSNLKTYGAGSGATWDQFCELLRSSFGTFIAKITREGEAPVKLTVIDGEITEEEYKPEGV